MGKMFRSFLVRITHKIVSRAKSLFATYFPKTRLILAENRGEGYIDTAIKILLAVVLGALLLAGLYALFGDTVMPELTSRINSMFNYSGT